MKRRELLKTSAAFGLIAAFPRTTDLLADPASPGWALAPADNANPLKPPASGSIPVAFLISRGAVLIDFVGPWEVFSNLMMGGRMDLFKTYTIAETLSPIQASGGMKIVPNFTLKDAPEPKVIVIPAQSDLSPAAIAWVRNSSKTADVTLSVCTGAFQLAQTGLLDGRSATTHHGAYVDLETAFPKVKVVRGARFVEEGNVASSGGLSSGIDLAFRVVERYFGSYAAEQAAFDMEYQGRGWTNPNSNSVYATARPPVDGHIYCPVCSMEVDPATTVVSTYSGKKYSFCSGQHKQQFDAAPAKFLGAAK
ncbi:MAG TPA: DJ-1/PfpI family protein [Candidatus Acidoferrum sp.]|jgi:putative intracellular protease/amidase/YHS domain-containing protein